MAKRVRYLVTVEEGCKMGGFGSAVLEALSDAGMTHVRTKVLGLPDWYIEQGPQDLPARTIWVDGGWHLREREGIVRQERLPRRRARLASSVDGCRTEMSRGADTGSESVKIA